MRRLFCRVAGMWFPGNRFCLFDLFPWTVFRSAGCCAFLYFPDGCGQILFLQIQFRVVLLIMFIKDYYWMVRDWTLLNLFLHLADCQSVTMSTLLPPSAQQSAKNKLQNRLNLINRTPLYWMIRLPAIGMAGYLIWCLTASNVFSNYPIIYSQCLSHFKVP